MARIVFQVSLDQDKKIGDLNATKVNLSTYNASVNDIHSKLTAVRNDFTAADKEVKAYADGLINGIKSKDIKALQDSVNVLNGDKAVKGSIDNKIAAAVTEIANGAPEAYNTLKELLDLINKDDTDLNGLIKNVNDKVAALKGNASAEFATLEAAEKTVQALDAKIKTKMTNIDANIVSVQESIPMYKFDGELAIAAGNKVTLSKLPKGDIIGQRAEVYSRTNENLMVVQGTYTITKDAKDASGKTYILESDDDLTAYKADVQYFFTVADNK